MKKFGRFFTAAAAVFILLQGCVHVGILEKREDPAVEEKKIEGLRSELDKNVEIYKSSIDDPYIKDKIRDAYVKLQDDCRSIAYRKGGFSSPKENALCDITKYPFDIFFNELYIETNGLKKQLFDITTPGTAANDYYQRPSEANLERLKQLFDQVHRYSVGTRYTWSRYRNKYLFSKSRLEHYKREWESRYEEYKEAVSKRLPKHEIELAKKRAEFAFRRFKEDCKSNNLPYPCQVNAFYLSDGLDDFMKKEKEENGYAAQREQSGRKKEVVIFIHGLGRDRESWRKFPLLLAHEDIADKSLKKYFKVYVFRYDTIEDSKSVEGFRRELTGFIDDIIKMEDVPYVNIVGHSFGGVTTLKCLVMYLDEKMKDFMKEGCDEKAKKIIAGYLSGDFKRPVKRFIGIAPSLSGSEMANIVADMFSKEAPLYQRNLPFFRTEIPGLGDIQIKENEIGSMINLISFERLNCERPLDPETLTDFLSKEDAKDVKDNERYAINGLRTEVLTIIGNPFDPFSPLAKSENDGLVKCYSANLNHIYLRDGDGKDDIGFKKAEVRYVPNQHEQLIEVENRNRPEYRYVVSFLNDELIPQEDMNSSKVQNFLVAARVHPAFIDIEKNPEMVFRQDDNVYYSEKDKYEVPKLEINFESESSGLKSENVSMVRASTNSSTGVFFFEGHVNDWSKPGTAVFKLKARGYKTKYVALKVEGGKVTYAPNLTMELQ